MTLLTDDQNTIRVLTIDGGGMKGYLPTCFADLFFEYMGIPANEVWKYYDVIAGTSIGGILALGLSLGLTPDEMKPFFTAEATHWRSS